MYRFFLIAVLFLGMPLAALHAQGGWKVTASGCREGQPGAGTTSAQRAVVRYAADCRSYQRPVMPADVLVAPGCIQVPASCFVRIIRDGRSVNLDGGKTYRLDSLEAALGKTARLSFMSRFYSFIEKCMDETTDEKSVVEHHRRHMDVTAGIKGYSSQDYPLSVTLLTEGMVSMEPLSFYWGDDPRADEYEFRLYENGSKVERMMKKLPAASLDITAAELGLRDGASYTWQVVSASNPALKTRPITFQVDAAGPERIREQVSKMPDYHQLTREEQWLSYAYALEQEQFFADAERVYARALQDYPENRLVRQTAAHFYSRMDMLDVARDLIAR